MKGKLFSAFSIAIIISGLIFAGGSHFCTAQNEMSTSNSATTNSYGANGNLELTLTVEKTSFIIGEPVNLTLTITNISNQTIDYTHTGLDFDFQVTNGTNNLVYQWSNFRAIAQFIAIIPLSAGENTSANFTWQQICNFNTQVQGYPISPGTYSIVGETGPTYNIQTTPIQVTITNTPTPTPTPTPTINPTIQPSQSPSITPSPTPSVPEFLTWITTALLGSILVLFVVLKKKQK